MLITSLANAQPDVIKADTTFGYDSLEVNFSFETKLTVTSIKWNFGNGTVSTLVNPICKYTQPGIYTVQLIINDTDTVKNINFIQVYEFDNIQIPNVFTPNDDQINDEFIVTSSGKSVLKLSVYTRTGLLVCKRVGKILRWDGRLASGDKALPGIYFYTIESNSAPSIKRSGFFYIFLNK